MGNVRLLYGAILMAVLLTVVSVASVSGNETIDTGVMGSIATLPLAFIANEGQFTDGIAFQTNSVDQVISLLHDRIEYIHADGSAPVSVIFMGAQPDPVIIGLDPMDGTASFFNGADSSGWTTGVELVRKVRYEELYPGIDMELSGSGGILKTEFIVHPGADPSQIALQYEGQTDIYIDNDGALIASTGTRDIIDDTPYSFQIVDESETLVESAYLLSEDAIVTFELGSYDPALPLIIDPVMRYSLYFGGANRDVGNAIAVDDWGYAYMLGTAMSRSLKWTPEFSVLSAQGNNAIDNSRDAFLVKINPDGTALEYLIYLGGSSEEEGNGLYLDTDGSVYLCGTTASTDFPIANAFRRANAGGRDAYVTKIDPSGTELIFSTYLGGINHDEALDITLDQDRNILLTGSTRSWDFPIVNRYEKSPFGGMVDAFITKMNPTASSIIYSNFMGGSAYDVGRAITVTPGGYAAVVGHTESRNFPIVNPFQAERRGHWNVFVVAFDPEGTYPAAYSTYLGGSGDEYAEGILSWPNGDITVVGRTNSKDFPIQNAIQPFRAGLWDGFITTFSPGGTSLVQSTYFGGTQNEAINGIARDGADNVYIVGTTNSRDFPTVNAYQSRLSGASDAFITKFDRAISMVGYSTFLGGTTNDEGRAIAVTTEGDAYVTGYTESKNFPQVWPFQQNFGDGNQDAFVAVISDNAFIPLPDFVGVPTNGEAPLTVQFTDLSRGIPTAWLWNFGDGATSTERDPLYTYTTPGMYTVSLRVSNIVSEQTLVKENYIVVRDPVVRPIADFMGVPQSGIVPLLVTFTDRSQNEPTSWAWDFGDGATSTERNPVYTYTIPGTYTVTLTVQNSAGIDTATKEQFVTAESAVLPPIADFNANPRSGVAPLTVKFADLSQNEPTSWSWNFGDGGTSTERHPTYTYTAPGTYTVALTVQNAAGIDTATKDQFVTAESGVLAPIANFNADPRIGLAPLNVRFIDLSRNNPTSWSWNFGDGATSTVQNPVHTYTQAGSYTISLTVANQAGADTATQTAFVIVQPGSLAPVADFNANPRSGAAPLTVKFADLSRNSPTSWSWDFGDGGTSMQQHPTYTYTAPGIYTVRLTVQNQAGSDTATKNQFITTTPGGHAPAAQFRAAPTTGTAPLHVAFTDLSTGGPTSWSWTFGDGATSNERHPEHVYTAPGTYTITLTARNEFGESVAQRQNYITVRPDLPALKASFIGEPTTGIAPLTVRFTDLSVGQPQTWQWNFGDGSTSTEQNPVHTYTQPGSYTVYLTVTRGDAQDVTARFNYIIVNRLSAIVVDFSAFPTSGDVPLCVQFTDLSTGEITSWSWTFGDGATSNERNPSHTYLEPGEYNVCLTASNSQESKQLCKPNFVRVSGSRLPAEFYGTVTIGDKLAPVGTMILARGPGVQTEVEGNPVTLSTPGCFGTLFPLTVFGTIKNGDPVTFWVKTPDMADYVMAEVWDVYAGNHWMESYPFYGGSRTRIDLRVGGNPIPPRPPLPHEFFGEVTHNGQPLPQGAMVLVKGRNVLEGRPGNPLPITSAGFYGTIGGMNDTKLIAQGDLEPGDELTFWVVLPGTAVPIFAQVRDVDAGSGWTDSYRYMEGGLTRLDLKAGTDSPPVPTIGMTISGRAIVDERPAAVGSLVTAVGTGVQTGIFGNPVSVVGSALYGTPDKLRVQGNIVDGTPISFTIFDSSTGLVYNAKVRTSLCALDADAQCAEFDGDWMDSYPFYAGANVILDLKAYSFIPMSVEEAADSTEVTKVQSELVVLETEDLESESS